MLFDFQAYGGFLSALLLLSQGSMFKCGIAVAPIANWRLYGETDLVEYWLSALHKQRDRFLTILEIRLRSLSCCNRIGWKIDLGPKNQTTLCCCFHWKALCFWWKEFCFGDPMWHLSSLWKESASFGFVNVKVSPLWKSHSFFVGRFGQCWEILWLYGKRGSQIPSRSFFFWTENVDHGCSIVALSV